MTVKAKIAKNTWDPLDFTSWQGKIYWIGFAYQPAPFHLKQLKLRS